MCLLGSIRQVYAIVVISHASRWIVFLCTLHYISPTKTWHIIWLLPCSNSLHHLEVRAIRYIDAVHNLFNSTVTCLLYMKIDSFKRLKRASYKVNKSCRITMATTLVDYHRGVRCFSSRISFLGHLLLRMYLFQFTALQIYTHFNADSFWRLVLPAIITSLIVYCNTSCLHAYVFPYWNETKTKRREHKEQFISWRNMCVD